MSTRTPSKAERLNRALLAEADASGKSLRAFCAERGVPVNRLYWWRHKLKWKGASADEPAAPQLLPVRVVDEAAVDHAPPRTYDVVMRCGRTLRVPVDLDVMRVAALVGALEASC